MTLSWSKRDFPITPLYLPKNIISKLMIITLKTLYKPMTSLLWLVSLAFVFSACHDSEIEPPMPEPVPEDTIPETEILVYSDDEELPMKQAIADFALEQFNAAQQGLSHQVKFSFKFADVDEPHFNAAASNYLLSGKYKQVITPDDDNRKYTRALLYTASRCFQSLVRAPGMIVPTMTSAEIVRTARSLPYVRMLTSDARGQLYTALQALHLLSSSPYVFLLCSDEDYGDTYSRFFKQYALDTGFKWVGDVKNGEDVNGLIKVKADISRAELERTIEEKYFEFCDALTVKNDSCLFFNFIVATDNPEHGLLIDSIRNTFMKDDPRIDMTDEILLNSQNAYKYADKYQDATYITFSSAPENTDFAVEFKKRFGRYPIQDEGNFYDAVLISLYAEYVRLLQEGSLEEGEKGWSGYESLNFILDGQEEVNARWDSQGIRNALEGYLQQKYVKLHGVSSEWVFNFDDNATCARRAYYSAYDFSDEAGGIHHDTPLLWVSSDITDDVWYANDGALNNEWKPEAVTVEDALTGLHRDFKDLRERWALLIAGTKSTENGKWSVNYRHQADVWNMYHLLKGHGYDDKHIIVITEDDIFGHQLYGEGPDENVVKRSHDADAVNLYSDIPTHYKLSDISQADIVAILNGWKSEHLPKVILAQEEDNIFIYWSGHGNSAGNLRWDGKNSNEFGEMPGLFTPSVMNTALLLMAETVGVETPDIYPIMFNFRRLMFVIETCYSGKFISQLPKTEGMLYLAAADTQESSWADTNNLILVPGAGGNTTIPRFDVFTSNFVNLIEQDPEISLGQLYEQLYNTTPDSHPLLFNNGKYGYLNDLYFTDFRTP